MLLLNATGVFNWTWLVSMHSHTATRPDKQITTQMMAQLPGGEETSQQPAASAAVRVLIYCEINSSVNLLGSSQKILICCSACTTKGVFGLTL